MTKDVKKESDVKESEKRVEKETKIGYYDSLIYALVDEALVAHRELWYIDMFDCVQTLLYVFRCDDSTILINRLESLRRGIDVFDIENEIVHIPAHNIMRAVSGRYDHDDDGGVWLVDCDGKKVILKISVLLEIYYYIGRILMVSLFEFLKDHGINLPENMYDNRQVSG